MRLTQRNRSSQPASRSCGPAPRRATAPLQEVPIDALHNRSSAATTAEASAWADVLVRRQLLHAAVRAPTGQWLVQHKPDGPVRVLAGPADVVDLAAAIQHRIRSTRHRIR
nr:hypothetical protein [Streptomyces roseicoloratus]